MAFYGAVVRVGEVVRAVEGPRGPVHCVDDPTYCDKVGRCATHDLWQVAAKALNELLDKYTVADLLAEQRRLDAAAKEKDSQAPIVREACDPRRRKARLAW